MQEIVYESKNLLITEEDNNLFIHYDNTGFIFSLEDKSSAPIQSSFVGVSQYFLD